MRRVLLDAGPLVALFNVRDKWRDYFDGRVRELSLSGTALLTTWPCVTEATHILERVENRADLLRWLAAGGALVRDLRADDLVVLAELIEHCSDRREMDFADASLVWLAAESGSAEILTVDRRDFERYRLPGGQRFTIL